MSYVHRHILYILNPYIRLAAARPPSVSRWRYHIYVRYCIGRESGAPRWFPSPSTQPDGWMEGWIYYKTNLVPLTTVVFTISRTVEPSIYNII